ncbi:MAG: methyltransferase [Burkholderiaceae bacterium]|jgi:SAM-dependent methyltransferase|nr:methyltransferase [Burkholderiaceae bacterium]MCU0963719.1 methyltransferase [Burkholderiaceae bacterium]
MRKLVKTVLRTLPDEGQWIKTSVRKIVLQKDLAAGRLAQHLKGATLPDPRTVYWIDPLRIEYATCLTNASSDWEDWVLPQKGQIDRVRAGDWDTLSRRFAEMRIACAIEDRIRAGTPWANTEYYKVAVSQIEGGRALWGCTSRADFDRHCERVDGLIDSISRAGYRDSQSIGQGRPTDTSLGQSEVLVNVSRDGLPLFQDGRHRLAIARSLGIGRIPVQVLVRHSDWQSLRELLHGLARSEGGASGAGFLYQKPAHFDLSDIPAAHACEDRWEAIAPLLLRGTGRALDIGCNLGFVCHRLEEAGYQAVGVEYLPDVAYAARRIAKAEGRRFTVINGDVLAESTRREIGSSDFAVVVALNIFHHFIKTEAGYERLRVFLGQLNIGRMFFEAHHPDDPQMQGVFANPSPTEFAQLIAKWSRLESVQPIHTAADGRTVFSLTRSGGR